MHQPSLIFASKARSLTLEWISVRCSTVVRLLALATNVRLGEKLISNTLAYYDTVTHTAAKSFIVQGLYHKSFTAVIVAIMQ